MTSETFLGYPIVCNKFMSCTSHSTCHRWRENNRKDSMGRRPGGPTSGSRRRRVKP